MNKIRLTDFAIFMATNEAFLLVEEQKTPNKRMKHLPSLTSLSPNPKVTKIRVNVALIKNPEAINPKSHADIMVRPATLASIVSKIPNPKITREIKNLPRTRKVRSAHFQI